METTFLVIFTLLFLFFQIYVASSNNIMIMTSSNVTCIERERQSLLVFRQGLMGESNRLSTWTGVECCEWQGVGCDRRNGHVVKLDLRSPLSFIDDYTLNTSNWLEGKVSPSLLNLKHLRYLDLSMNNFSGQNIPEFFGSFKYLEYLNLSLTGFSGVVPPHLGNLSRLQYLDLNLLDRYHMVSLPYDVSLKVKDDLRWVSLLSSLKHLDFSGITIGNHIDWFHPVNMLPSLLTLNLASCDISNIPFTKFINFTSLNSLDLSYNGINSTIPVWLSNLTGLVHLDLHNNSFHGRIPDSIGTLSSLSSIDLSSNRFNTSMPDLFWNLSSLVRLDLSSNVFHGPVPADVKLCNLSVLDLSENRFVEDLSGFIKNVSSDCLHNSLKDLHLEGNNFNGRIPNRIGEFKKLEFLGLSKNTLSGPIPPSLGQLSNLQYLSLSYNQLSGSIPESIGQLSMLERLALGRNQLSGSIPESIGQLSMLEILDLHLNQLSGSIPESIGQLSMLEYLWLGGNQLSGSIPESIGQLSNLQWFDVSGYSLVGVVSEIHFTKLNNLIILRLYDNSLTLNVSPHWIPPFQLEYFEGSSCNMGPQFPNWLQTQTHLEGLRLSNSSIRDRIPEWFGKISSHFEELDLSDNQISGKLPRFNGSGLQVVNLGKNRFTGSVPTHLCELLSISVLDLSDNNFSGILPKCLGNLIQLRVMDLTNNDITGDVPNSLGALSYLQSLHLHNNKFKGSLPVALQNLTSLVTFDLGNNLLTGNIPSWIGKKLSKLKILNLRSNKFIGKIPVELCQNNALQHLNLANNNITGMIPHCFYNLTGMKVEVSEINFGYQFLEYKENIETCIKGIQLKYTSTIQFLISLDLSSNKIIGEIPDVLMNLVALKNLNLSRNLLSGQIPTTIGNLKQLESLDLSTNRLFGRIPPSLASLNFLSYLNLSFNNLSGQVPVGNQLQTLGNPPTIYEGNTELCGPSLPRSCKENFLSYAHVGEDEGKDGLQGFSWFYAGMVSGFIVGFLGLIGSLHFIRIWRVTYFEMIENVYAFLMVSIIVALARLRRKIF